MTLRSDFALVLSRPTQMVADLSTWQWNPSPKTRKSVTCCPPTVRIVYLTPNPPLTSECANCCSATALTPNPPPPKNHLYGVCPTSPPVVPTPTADNRLPASPTPQLYRR